MTRFKDRLIRLALPVVALALLGNADYILPTPDGGGPDPSPPSLVGVLRAASPLQLMVLPKAGSAPIAVALDSNTSMFTVYGGVVSVDRLVVGGSIEIWYTEQSIAQHLSPPVAAVVRVETRK
jgi:hypothetical protein